MKNTTILFIGMDTHKETTDVAYVEEDTIISLTTWANSLATNDLWKNCLGSYSPSTPKQHCILLMKPTLAAIGSIDYSAN